MGNWLCNKVGLFCPTPIAPKEASFVSEDNTNKTTTRKVTPEQIAGKLSTCNFDLNNAEITIEEPKDQPYFDSSKSYILKIAHKPENDNGVSYERIDYCSYEPEKGLKGLFVERQTSKNPLEITEESKIKDREGSAGRLITKPGTMAKMLIDVAANNKAMKHNGQKEPTTEYVSCGAYDSNCSPSNEADYMTKTKKIPHFVNGKLVRE